MYRIGEFSKLGKTTIKTLRYYDEIGLLKPAKVDSETGYRSYTTDQLFQLHEIVGLRQIGFSISEIQAMTSGGQIEEILKQRKAEIQLQLEAASTQLSRISHLIENYQEENRMKYQIVIKEIPKCIVYAKRLKIASYDEMFQVIPAIGESVTKVNPTLQCAKPEYCFNIFLDGEYKETDIEMEFCEAVTEFGVETDGIIFKEMEAVTVASVMHKGPYHTLGAAYAFLFQWIDENGYRAAGNPRESYIDGIWNQVSESEWLTEVQVPVLK